MRNGVMAVPWYLLAALIVLLDQYTKGVASSALEYARPEPVFSWLSMTLHHNEGAAFSIFSDAGGWQRYFFSAVAIGISGVLIVWLFLADRQQRLLILSLSLILGGAIGNLWDRVSLGYVVDFISVHYENRHFPAFNVADSAICVGAFFMLLDSFLNRETSVEDSGADT